MRRVAASMIASRVDRPSRGRLVGLGVLVAVIVCTNRLVQNPTLSNAPRQEPRGERLTRGELRSLPTVVARLRRTPPCPARPKTELRRRSRRSKRRYRALDGARKAGRRRA